MKPALLVINSGSSSVKFAAYEAAGTGNAATLNRIAHGRIESPGSPEAAFVQLFDGLAQETGGRPLLAVGHRVVHGGAQFQKPARVTPAVLAQLEALSPLAPLHQPHNLSAIHAVARLFPELPQVACFDTEFHTAQPWVAQACALPRRFTEAGVKRYGFHGLSYEYIASALPAALGPLAEGRVVVAHLGNGASLCAMRGRRSVASTMGFSTLDGLMMGTRCGSLDPGIVLHLLGALGMSVSAVEKLLYEESGLLGVSSISSDMRTLEASAAPEAQQAIELYTYRLNQQLGSMAAALGGLDALVFTAGIGENSVLMRQRVGRDAAWLGLELDAGSNQAAASGARCISLASSRVAVWVIPTNEELMIARHTQAVLRGNSDCSHEWMDNTEIWKRKLSGNTRQANTE
jgi:acetate kinase